MKFFGKSNLRRFAAVAAIGSALIFCNGGADAAPSEKDLAAFREVYTAQAPGTGIFEHDLTLIAPTFNLDIDARAQILKDGSLRVGGNFVWTYTNLKNNFSTNNSVPFYIEQVENEMTLYVQRRGKWSKMSLPGLPAGVALMWKTTDAARLEENIKSVKAVEVTKETPDLRIMNATLDGAKVADNLDKYSQATFAKLSGDELAAAKKSFNGWLAALRASEINFSWTVNKPSLTTATAFVDFTPIMRAYARYVLDESAAGRVVLTDEARDLLDTIGYYSELKDYTTQISNREDNQVNLPSILKTAPEDKDSLNDIIREMTTVVEK